MISLFQIEYSISKTDPIGYNLLPNSKVKKK